MWWMRSAASASADADDEVAKFARELLFEEYKTLRLEAHQSLSYAQGIVRWSVAVYGAVLAAALLAASRVSGADGYSFFGTAVLLLFGFALPGLSWAAAWTWLGELTRMERAGAYMRGLEAQIAALPDIQKATGGDPLRWERFIASPRRDGTHMGKQTSSYLGTAAVFFGATAISLIIFGAWWGYIFGWMWPWVDGSGTLWWWPLSGLVFEVVCVLWAFRMFGRLRHLGKHTEFPIVV